MKKSIKILVSVLLCYIGLFFFVYFVLFQWTNPQVSKFSDYQSLINWDLNGYGIGDFDEDGEKDFISYTGCAFLSKADLSNVSDDKKCVAKNSEIIFTAGKEMDLIGQKYISLDQYNVDPNGGDEVFHSYLARYNDSHWRIYLNANGNLKIFDIGNDGIIKETNEITLANRLDEVLYFISTYSMYIFFITIPIAYIISPFLLMMGGGNSLFVYITLLVIGVSFCLYMMVKKVGNTHRIQK
jgi:hypothetical protein